MQKYLHSFLALLVAGTVGAKNISLMADPLTLTTNVTGTVCASSGIVMFLKGCPSGAAYEITNAESSVVKGTSTGDMTITTKATPVAGSNDIKYTATCKVDASTTTTTTTTITVSPIDVRWVNVGQSKTALRPSGQGFATTDWPTINATSGPSAINSTVTDRSVMDYTGPRYWSLEAFYCLTTPAKTMEFVLVNETTSQTYKAVEAFSPWFLFGNSRSESMTVPDSYYRLWTIDDDNFGLGAAFKDTGLPKGKYTLTVRAVAVAAAVPAPYPPVRIADTNPANTLATRTFYFDIAPSQANRLGAVENEMIEKKWAFAFPNPAVHTVDIAINGEKGNEVKLELVDVIGRPVMSRVLTPETDVHREGIDVSLEPNGIYFMQVASPSKKATIKVLKVSRN